MLGAVFRREKRWAAIFADDLLAGCDGLLAAHGASAALSLPISIPIDPSGVVLLRPDGPLDAPRVPAILSIERLGPDHHTIAIERQDGGPIVIPGIDGPTPHRLVADVTTRGLAFSGELTVDEETARSYANALFLTLQRKLARAGQTRNP